MKPVIEDAVLVHGQVEAGGRGAEARRHAQELQKGRDQLKLKILAGELDQRLRNVIEQHLSLWVLTVFFGLLLGLIRAPRPPVPLVSGPLGGEPDLPPGQTLISYFLVLVFWFVVIII